MIFKQQKRHGIACKYCSDACYFIGLFGGYADFVVFTVFVVSLMLQLPHHLMHLQDGPHSGW